MLKLFKDNDFKLEHSSNIDSMSITFDVSNVFKSKDNNDSQPLNISHIISTFLV